MRLRPTFQSKVSALIRLAAFGAFLAAASSGAGPLTKCESILSGQLDGTAIAQSAGLHYATPGGAGITRATTPEGEFTYLDPSGNPIDDPATLQRIKDLAIPPGYRDVWISPDPESHIQAIALDSKGREQYRYHPKWIAAKSHVKFTRMLSFGASLPAIHTQEETDLRLPGLARDKVLAAMTRLLEKSYIRIGNARYAAENESYGLTTLLNEQVQVKGSFIRFLFKGKSGVYHDIDVNDPELAAITRQSLNLQQARAFAYVDDTGVAHPIDSETINDYIRRISGGHFTAKDFRTWGGTTLAAKSLLESPVPTSPAQAQANVEQAVRYAAENLGNTPSVCRANYIDPRLFEAYLDGRFERAARQIGQSLPRDGFKSEERLVLSLLKN